jgi:Tfp pilus assembly protein PilF
LIPSNDDIKRQVIPRWRTIRATTAVGELAAVIRQPATELEDTLSVRLAQEFQLRVKEWQQESDAAAAEELLAAVSVSGSAGFQEDVNAAAELILNDVQTLAGSRELAHAVLGNAMGNKHEPIPTETAKMRLEIARRKRLLRTYPRDALLLTETALLYTNLGLNNSAMRLLKSAAALAPDNRYVLRSLTRFWVHQAEPDRALHFLSKSVATRRDPWLLAAQMAVEDVAQKSPSNWREARRILGTEQFSEFELTELAAAFGTLQLQAGSHKLARKMFRRSLTAPTENSVAQAQWASRRDPTINVSHELTLKASEALAWEQLALARWHEAIEATRSWREIEPFSVRPAVMGSFIAVAHMGDGKVGEEFSRRGLIANNGVAILHNNLAVALAIQGRIAEAKAELSNVKPPALDSSAQIVNLATRGLIAMRSGNLDAGAELYHRAIELAITLRNAALWCRASANFAYECARYDKSTLAETSAAIMSTYNKLSDPAKFVLNDIPTMLSRAEKLQPAADMIRSLEQFKNPWTSYPVADDSN